jgi:mono/diheme cytochrome c family protein/uncharacterized membrane protein
MTSGTYPKSARFYFGLTTLSAIVLLFALFCVAAPDGGARATWLQFLGRFHPLAVHMPIALLLLLPLIEMAGRTRFFPSLLQSADFILALSTCGAIAAATLGWLLAKSGGYSGSLVTQHMWGGIAVAAASWLCWVLRGMMRVDHPGTLYTLALIAAVGLVAFTGYRGGQLTLGENHLTQFMPDGLRGLLGVSNQSDANDLASNPGPGTFYGAHIQPIFSDHCVSCHGPSKHKSNLRLDTYAGLMRGAKHGAVVKAGNSKGSELFHRITLPSTDDNFMPAEHKPPLSDSQVKLIGLWISSGASSTQVADAIKDIPVDARISQVAEATFPEIDTDAVTKQRAPLAAAVSDLKKRLMGGLDYESRGSADLVVNVSLLGSRFTDQEMAALRPVVGHIVVADFSDTAITDRSAATIAAMEHLRVLRLIRTRITDATLQTISALAQLQSLNVFGTAVTPAALPAIAHMPRLQHIYASETKIARDSSIPEPMKSKILF